ncbi:MAG: hypothetical protein OXI96_09030, partial [Acidimicrobiaceae bacterium]|nr:hypothetical protein [Acidimicrobiaceae bacterium]
MSNQEMTWGKPGLRDDGMVPGMIIQTGLVVGLMILGLVVAGCGVNDAGVGSDTGDTEVGSDTGVG